MPLRRDFWWILTVFAVALSVVSSASTARAQPSGEVPPVPDDGPPPRPIEYLSVELNPLVLLVRRVSGQVQIGVVGPLSIVGSVSRLSLAESQHYSAYDETVFGQRSLNGTLFEIGPRLFAPLGSSRPTRVYFWVQPSFLIDALEQGPELTCDGRGGSSGCTRKGGTLSIHRQGVAFDAGIHIRLVTGLYVLVGAGLSHKSSATGLADAKTSSPVSGPPLYSGSPTVARLLASVGVGF